MWLKEMLKGKFTKEKDITLERYKAAKFMFIFSALVFFLNFYFVGAQLHLSFFSRTLNITYVLLLLSFVFYFFFFVKKNLLWKIPNFLFVILIMMLGLLFTFLILPLIIKGWFMSVLNLL